MSKKLDINRVKSKINEKCNNYDYTFLGFENGWIGAKNTKLNLKCNEDNYEWKITYNNYIYELHTS